MPKTSIITGASSGIGAACGLALARRGFRVCLMARRAERLAALETQIRGAVGDDAAISVPGDVTKEEDRARAVQRTLERWKRIDLLVNNAGYALPGAIEDVRIDAVRRQFEVNAFAYLAWMQEVAPLMAEQGGGGRIINIGSVSGLMAFPGLGVYAASKYAIEAFSDAARREWRPYGVDIVLVEPGSVTSEIWDVANDVSSALRQDWHSSRHRRLYEMAMQRAERMRAGHGPAPDVVAAAVVKVATVRRPRARYCVTTEAKVVSLLSKLPASIQDWALRRVMG